MTNITPIWSVAVFAHNEAANIAATINSVLAAGEGANIEVVVLANGCCDQTAVIVHNIALLTNNLRVLEIPLADKANAWNLYVHEIAARPPFNHATMHVFVDGDVRIQPGSLKALAAILGQRPDANAVGGLPTTGRDRDAWIQRMVANGTLAGGLYALRGNFIDRIRQHGIHIPRRLIGEDWLVSLFAKSDLRPFSLNPVSASHVVFASNAGFSFRSLSPWRFKDYQTYLRRLWRYSLRGVQFEMLFGWLFHNRPEDLPADVEQLYLLGLPPSRLKWVGFTSVLRLLAVQKVRLARTKRLNEPQ